MEKDAGVVVSDSNRISIPRSKSSNRFAVFAKELIKNRTLYLMALPGMLVLFFFNYLPLFGLVLAFKEFNFKDGIWGSPWQTPIFNNFRYLFESDGVIRATRNTIGLNLMFIIVGTIFAMMLAIALNEITHDLFKRLSQSFTFLPYFMSWIVVSVFIYGIFSTETGALNNILGNFGIGKIDWYTSPMYWPIILLFITIWKGVGYNSVIYLATLSGIDSSYYEAAKLDGASRWQLIRYISIPLMMPTAIILSLLALGRIMNADFGMFYGVIGDNSLLFSTTDVLDTFIYRNLRVLGDIGMASAASFYQSIIGFITVMVFNRLARSYDPDSSLF